jgi:hypothetical protein
MKKFIGTEVKFVVAEIGPINGVVVGDQRDRVLVKGDDGKVVRLIKSKIIAFTPEKEPNKKGGIPLHVLCCENLHTGCPGVQFVHQGQGFTQRDCDAFMDACPCKADDCRRGTKGELSCVDPAFLAEMLVGTLYGDYPEAGKK